MNSLSFAVAGSLVRGIGLLLFALGLVGSISNVLDSGWYAELFSRKNVIFPLGVIASVPFLMWGREILTRAEEDPDAPS